jgi:AcrR family transcriptional regulator
MRTVNPEQHALRRAAIIGAAAQEFAENGIDATSTASICRRAGIGSGTLFHYFSTKRDIVHAMFADDLQTNARACEAALVDRDPAAGLGGLLTHLLRDLGDPLVPGLMATALLQVNRDAEFAALLAADQDLIRATLIRLLERLGQRGAHPRFPPASTAGWIQRLIDAAFLGAGDPDFEAQRQAAELRRIVAFIVGSSDGTA